MTDKPGSSIALRLLARTHRHFARETGDIHEARYAKEAEQAADREDAERSKEKKAD